MKYFILYFLLTLSLLAPLFSQTDSSVVYVDSKPRWKTVYVGENMYFYKIDTTGTWNLYGKWTDTLTERYYYSFDSVSNEYLTYIDIWEDDVKYSYLVDSLGFETLNSTTYYYGNIGINTMKKEFDNSGIIISEKDGLITVQSIAIIQSVQIYDIEGRLLYYNNPLATTTNIFMYDGVLIIKVITEIAITVRKLLID